MCFIKTIKPGDATGDVRSMYARQQMAWGYVPNYAKVFCYRPEVMTRWARLLAEIRRPMDSRRFELVTFAAAHALRNSACSVAHGQALTAFFDENDIQKFARSEASEAITDAESAMMEFARKIARDASAITDSDVQVLRDHGLSEEEIFDIAAAAAGRAFFTKLLDSLGVTPDSSFLKMDRKLRDCLVIGRPIDRREPDVMPLDEGTTSTG